MIFFVVGMGLGVWMAYICMQIAFAVTRRVVGEKRISRKEKRPL